MVTVAAPAATESGISKLICPGETNASSPAVVAPVESLIEMVSPPRLAGHGTDVTLSVVPAILVPKAVTMDPFATGPVAKLAELVSVNVNTGGTTAAADRKR